MECAGGDWAGNKGKVNGKIVLQMMTELLAFFPCKFLCKMYHTGVMINLFVAGMRKLLPEIKEMYQVGCEFDGHLGEAMLVPTVELANQRLLQRMDQALQQYYDNVQTFKLHEDYSDMFIGNDTDVAAIGI